MSDRYQGGFLRDDSGAIVVAGKGGQAALSGFAVQGVIADIGELPSPGTTGQAYLLDGEVYVWIAATTSWTNIGPVLGVGGVPGPPGPPADLALVQPRSEKGQVNGYCELGSDGKVPANKLPAATAPKPVVIPWSVGTGDVAVGVYPRPFVFPTDATGISVRAAAGTAPDAQSLIADVNKNGTTIFSTQPNRPAIPAGLKLSPVATPDVTTASVGDILTVDVDQVGIQPPGGTVAFVSSASQSTANNVTTYSITRPTVQVGDLMLVMLYSAVTNMNTPAGWTQIGTRVLVTTNRNLYQYWRIDDGSAGPWTWDNATSQNMSTILARKFVYRGTHQTAPIDANSNSIESTATRAVAALTTLNDNSRVLMMLDNASSGSSQTAALPSGYTARTGFDGVSALNVHLCDKLQATAGAADTPTVTTSGAAAAVIARLAIRPAPAPAQWTPGKDLSVILRYLEA